MKKLTIRKTIPSSYKVSYLNLGWTELEDLPYGQLSMQRVLYTNETTNRMDEIICTPPELLQRGCIYRPLGLHKELPLQRAVDLENMGSEEFALHKRLASLRRIESQFLLYRQTLTTNITAFDKFRKEHPLRMYHNFDTFDQLKSYIDALHKLFHDPAAGLRLQHEPVLGRTTPNLALDSTDFWWDIANDVLLTFDKQFISNIHHMVRRSITNLNSE